MLRTSTASLAILRLCANHCCSTSQSHCILTACITFKEVCRRHTCRLQHRFKAKSRLLSCFAAAAQRRTYACACIHFCSLSCTTSSTFPACWLPGATPLKLAHSGGSITSGMLAATALSAAFSPSFSIKMPPAAGSIFNHCGSFSTPSRLTSSTQKWEQLLLNRWYSRPGHSSRSAAKIASTCSGSCLVCPNGTDFLNVPSVLCLACTM
mmetsp:Transcript_64876/g.120699  ORF Transcript_64876/g.120699 Transcript_64876/m.120699 type:complete len:209 (+) Transcript_64876:413-1039(+)